MKTTDTDRLMLREFAVEAHAGEPSYVTKRRERVYNILDDFETMKNALKACGISSDNPDTCGVCGLHFADCEEERLVDDINGTFVEIGFACPGAVARQIVQEKPIEEEDRTQPDWELCRHDILRKRCIACSKDNL